MGETARADHFDLNGYPLDTTPQLAGTAGLINYDIFWSCGTEIAVSVRACSWGWGGSLGRLCLAGILFRAARAQTPLCLCCRCRCTDAGWGHGGGRPCVARTSCRMRCGLPGGSGWCC
ncbi:hypothetical protein [Chitinolyticbacter meiyuanensis]|uniref:hypothetical protein n=1 Tax=Chitinolyticbacter meiyuanensis TaxID=682798 RepID=UPI003570AA7F